MSVFSRYFLTFSVAVCVILVIGATANLSAPRPSRSAKDSSAGLPIAVVIWTDHGKYSVRDSLKLSASLKNSSDSPVYVDRRMFWTGFGGGLKLEINDEQGKPLPVRPFSDAIMPPPNEGDITILIRLDQGFFYGTSVNLVVKDFFPKPGKYSVRVIYKSWLRKESVPPQLRDLPAIWADTPDITSAPVLIDITQ